MTPRKQTYGIRKLKLGAASLLLGVTFSQLPAVLNSHEIISAETTSSKEITPQSLTVSVSGKDRFNNDIANNSQVIDGGGVILNVAMDLADGSVKEGDTLTLKLPETVTGRPSTSQVKNAQGEVVANVVITGDTAKLTFTDVFSKGNAGKLNFSIGTVVGNNTIWPNGQVSEMKLTDTSGNEYSSGINLVKFVSQAVDFGTSTRLWPATLLPDENGNRTIDPYQFWQQSEVAKFGDGQPRQNVTVVYTIDPDTQDYARYDVDSIRNNGYEIRFGESRSNHKRYNTKNNDLGITATVNDEGTELVLTFPEWPANWGLNGGSIPTNLTDLAKEVKYSLNDGNTYNATMRTYIDGVLRSGEFGTRYAKNIYPFAGADASQQQKITTKFIDVDTKEEIASAVVKNAAQGSDYTTSPTDAEYYKLVTTPSNASGKVTTSDITVTYEYKKTGDVITHYVLMNEDGTTSEFNPDVLIKDKAFVGENYTTAALEQSILDAKDKPETKVEEFEDRTQTTTYAYELVETPTNATGEVAHKLTEVTYVYKLVPTTTTVYKYGNVTVEHVAEDGTVLKATETIVNNAVVGTEYTSVALNESELVSVAPKTKVENLVDRVVTTTYHYELVETPVNASGKVTEETTTIQYVYKLVEKESAEMKYGNVTVEHVAEDGTILKAVETIVDNQVVGTDYTSEPLTQEQLESVVPSPKVEELFDRTVTTTYTYELIEVPSNAVGQVSDGTTSVKYVYKQVATVTEELKYGSVSVEYVTEDGTVLKEKETVVDNAVVGTGYSTSTLSKDILEAATPAPKVEEHSDRIVTTTYKYALVAVPNNANGNVVEGVTTVTYVYKLVETVSVEMKNNPIPVNPKKSETKNDGTEQQSELPKTGQSDTALPMILGTLVSLLGLSKLFIRKND